MYYVALFLKARDRGLELVGRDTDQLIRVLTQRKRLLHLSADVNGTLLLDLASNHVGCGLEYVNSVLGSRL